MKNEKTQTNIQLILVAALVTMIIAAFLGICAAEAQTGMDRPSTHLFTGFASVFGALMFIAILLTFPKKFKFFRCLMAIFILASFALGSLVVKIANIDFNVFNIAIHGFLLSEIAMTILVVFTNEIISYGGVKRKIKYWVLISGFIFLFSFTFLRIITM